MGKWGKRGDGGCELLKKDTKSTQFWAEQSFNVSCDVHFHCRFSIPYFVQHLCVDFNEIYLSCAKIIFLKHTLTPTQCLCWLYEIYFWCQMPVPWSQNRISWYFANNKGLLRFIDLITFSTKNGENLNYFELILACVRHPPSNQMHCNVRKWRSNLWKDLLSTWITIFDKDAQY